MSDFDKLKGYYDVNLEGEHPVVIGLSYAEWCGYCKSLLPDWLEMMNKIKTDVDSGIYKAPQYLMFESEEKDALEQFNKKHSNILAAKEGFPSGFPTIFTIKNKKVIIYDGKREVDAMIKWFYPNHTNTEQQGGKKRRRRGTRTIGGRRIKKTHRRMKNNKSKRKMRK
jgi:thiol-disulfide isomerase/thioredoxin